MHPPTLELDTFTGVGCLHMLYGAAARQQPEHDNHQH